MEYIIYQAQNRVEEWLEKENMLKTVYFINYCKYLSDNNKDKNIICGP